MDTQVRQETVSRQIARPEAIRACIAALAAEAFEAGHIRAARLLAHTAALLALPQLWDGAGRP